MIRVFFKCVMTVQLEKMLKGKTFLVRETDFIVTKNVV